MLWLVQKKMADNDFKDIGLKTVFKSALKGIVSVVKIAGYIVLFSWFISTIYFNCVWMLEVLLICDPKLALC